DRSTKSLQVRLLTAEDGAIPFELRDQASELVDHTPEILVNAQGIYDGDQVRSEAFLYTHGVARDISERFRLEASLVEARARFEERLDTYAIQLRQAHDRLQAKAAQQELETLQRQWLQQMRDAVWRMAGPDGVSQLLRVLHEGLVALGVEHYGLAIIHVGDRDTCERAIHSYLWPSEEMRRSVSDANRHDDLICSIIDQGQPHYRPDLDLDDPHGEREHIQAAWEGPVRCVLDVPFSTGTIALNSLKPDAFDQDLRQFLVEVANVVEEGYHRAADLEALQDRRQAAETSALERERAFERLEHSQQSYRGLVEDLPVGIAHSTPDGQILYANPQVREMFGYTDDQWQRLRLEDLYENAADLADWTRDLQRDGVTSFETSMRRQNGERIWVRGTSRRVHNPVTSQEEYHGVLEDITERRKLEDERRRLEDQLRQAQRMEAVGQLTAGISHNFNNMLQGISGNLQLALLDAPDGLKSMLTDADRVTHRAAEMVQQLVVFSRQGSRGDIHRQHLRPILLSALEICRRTFDRRIRLTDAIADDLEVLGDAALLQQAVLNMMINARDAVEEKDQLEPTIHLQALPHRVAPGDSARPPGAYVCIAIGDNGIGMDSNTQRRIYEPFFTTKPVDRGTGLGLATVYGIVTQHAGWLECDSKPDEGTTFRLFLPTQEPPSAATLTAGPVQVTGAASRGTLLIIDDEDLVRDSTARLLERAGYQILTAASGERGLEIFADRGQDIDMILLDLSMPTMSGHEVLMRMRKQDADVRVLILTGYAIGDVDFDTMVLRKPFTIAELEAKVNEVLR
ncbi:MAG: response regulator, partial [Gemmatimonadetes bacterium]|nr:response regulator [Gemmatimonadota bacterium]